MTDYHQEEMPLLNFIFWGLFFGILLLVGFTTRSLFISDFKYDIGDKVCIKETKAYLIVRNRGFQGTQNRYEGYTNFGARGSFNENELMRCK